VTGIVWLVQRLAQYGLGIAAGEVLLRAVSSARLKLRPAAISSQISALLAKFP
jgi:hypothetical protein